MSRSIDLCIRKNMRNLFPVCNYAPSQLSEVLIYTNYITEYQLDCI